MPSVIVNGAELYHEVRGTGPPVLLIMGATGDGGHFDALADRLADEFTVISYDRRGNGRSPAARCSGALLVLLDGRGGLEPARAGAS